MPFCGIIRYTHSWRTTMKSEPIIQSVLDTDLYKLTQGYAVAKRYPRARVQYKFFNRGKTPFPKGFAAALRSQVDAMQSLALTVDEAVFLTHRCGAFLDPQYIDWLKGYRFNPAEVNIIASDDETEVSIDIGGYWYRTIYWEVPLMSIISELYFKMVDKPVLTETGEAGDFELDMRHVRNKAANKGMRLLTNVVPFADFGTRRRYSYKVQEEVVRQFTAYRPPFVGTSNVHFAHMFDIAPIGTQAHEWFMFHGAKYGYRSANKIALGRWADIFGGRLGIALTDTFTTDAFFKAFDIFYAKLFDGVRHDSADPTEFGEKVIKHYENFGIDPRTKTIVFSDGLSTEKAIELKDHFADRIRVSFGIGTHFTNDVGVKPLNIVIKMTAAEIDNEWVPTIKLSDVEGKHTGKNEEISFAKGLLRV